MYRRRHALSHRCRLGSSLHCGRLSGGLFGLGLYGCGCGYREYRFAYIGDIVAYGLFIGRGYLLGGLGKLYLRQFIGTLCQFGKCVRIASDLLDLVYHFGRRRDVVYRL
ncbi:MAG: hypothetical protein IJ080_09295 [Oscillospiraceae bacterium]|nr:hypothetical protein [Oscillospiraceae bacterium]